MRWQRLVMVKTGKRVDDSLFVSVVIPAFNSERFICNAIQSVFDQEYSPIEVIVVDDGSTDGTKNEVLKFGERIKYKYQKNGGPAAARNAGIASSRGDIIGFLDSDDIWTPGRLPLMLNKFKDDPSLDVVLGRVQVAPLPDATHVHPNLLKPHIAPLFGSGLFKCNVFAKVGLLDQSLRYSEDQDWFLRMKELGIHMVILSDVTLVRQKHSDSMTEGASWSDVDIIKVIKKSLDRRRFQNRGKVPGLPKLSDYEEKK